MTPDRTKMSSTGHIREWYAVVHQVLGALWWRQLCTIDTSLNFTRSATSSQWRLTCISCLRLLSNFLVSLTRHTFKRRCNLSSRSLRCARKQYITAVDVRSKRRHGPASPLTLNPVIAGHVTVDLWVAAVQKHDPTWGWNRPQVDGGRLGYIRLDLTWLDSGMWLESTSNDFTSSEVMVNLRE